MTIESVWYDADHECNVVVIHMPGKVREAVTVNEDGSHTIFLNADKSDADRRDAYRHGLSHVESDDMASEEDVGTIECRAHRKG